MRQVLVFALLALGSGGIGVQAEPLLALGVGMESRIQPDVNPDYSTLQNLPEIYYEVLFKRWGAELEFAQEGRTSSSGGLSVESHTTNVDLWGRYMFKPPGGWSPFVAGGLGVKFDQLNTRFQTFTDHRAAQRGMLGLSAGIASTWWKVLLVELEARMEMVDNRQDPLFSGVFRIGVTTY